MTKPDEHIPDDSQLQAPSRLASALKRLGKGAPPVPPELDAEISTLAKRQFEATRRRRSTLRWLSASAAAAALLIPVLWFTYAGKRSPFDVNGDGRVDILDAYALALKLQSSKVASTRFDVNHDGVVDSRDVEAIAMQAVRLDGRHSQ